MTQAQKEALFNKHRWIAEDVAARICRNPDRGPSSRPHYEVLDTAIFALTMALFDDDGYDPKKGSYHTWLWQKVYWYLKEVYTRGKHPHQALREFHVRERHLSTTIQDGQESDAKMEEPTAPTSWYQSLLAEVSEEGAVLLQTIVEAPEEIIDELHTNRRTVEARRETVRSYLIDVLDWDYAKLNRAWQEVEACVRP